MSYEVSTTKVPRQHFRKGLAIATFQCGNDLTSSTDAIECETACRSIPSLSKLISRDCLDSVCFAYYRSSMLASHEHHSHYAIGGQHACLLGVVYDEDEEQFLNRLQVEIDTPARAQALVCGRLYSLMYLVASIHLLTVASVCCFPLNLSLF